MNERKTSSFAQGGQPLTEADLLAGVDALHAAGKPFALVVDALPPSLSSGLLLGRTQAGQPFTEAIDVRFEPGVTLAAGVSGIALVTVDRMGEQPEVPTRLAGSPAFDAAGCSGVRGVDVRDTSFVDVFWDGGRAQFLRGIDTAVWFENDQILAGQWSEYCRVGPIISRAYTAVRYAGGSSFQGHELDFRVNAVQQPGQAAWYRNYGLQIDEGCNVTEGRITAKFWIGAQLWPDARPEDCVSGMYVAGSLLRTDVKLMVESGWPGPPASPPSALYALELAETAQLDLAIERSWTGVYTNREGLANTGNVRVKFT